MTPRKRTIEASIFFYFTIMLIVGCSSDTPNGMGLGDHTGLSLIRNAEFEGVYPEEFVQGGELALTLVVDSRYECLANIGLAGVFLGSPVGMLVAPVEGELGQVNFEKPLQPGRNEIIFVVEMTSSFPSAAFSFFVTIDSLKVGDRLVHWQSPEGYSVYEDDIPTGSGDLFNSRSWSIIVKKESN